MRRMFQLVFLLACLAYAGSRAAAQAHSLRDRSVVAKLTERMKAVCAGRYSIDVPAQAAVSTSHERIDGFAVETVEESEASCRQRIAARELPLQVRGDTRSHGIESGRRVDVEWASVEVHGHKSDSSFSLSANYVDESDAKAAEALLARLQLRREDEIPTVGGCCIRHTVCAKPLPPHSTEHIATHIELPGHPDLSLTLVSSPGGGSAPGLSARTARIPVGASAEEALRVTRVRSKRRDIHGLAGEEVIERIQEFNSTTTYKLNRETPGVEDNILLPYLSVEAQAGIGTHPDAPPAGSSLHEDALLALWDRIVSSIRLPKENMLPQAQPPRLPAQRLSTRAQPSPKVAHNA